MNAHSLNKQFVVIAHESGRDVSALPTWSDDDSGVLRYDDHHNNTVERRNVDDVPGAFQLFDVLSDDECDQFVSITETMGYHADSPVSLPHSIRHNCNVNWVVSESVDGPIWRRCASHVTERMGSAGALGINARFRFYRYEKGDFFRPHTDGAWPGSRVINGQLVQDAYGDRASLMTFLLFLSDGYEGGRTLFFVPQKNGIGIERQPLEVAVETPKGAALCFPHGAHPQHCVHAGEEIKSGNKYIMRSDILFPFVAAN
ncbi:MAG: 2OG-Fe(II) oxygenase [Pseudomonadota bacterium]